MTLGGLGPLANATNDKSGKVRVATVFLANTDIREIWPYPNFDADARQREVLAALRQGCGEIEFVPVTVKKPEDGLAIFLRFPGTCVGEDQGVAGDFAVGAHPAVPACPGVRMAGSKPSGHSSSSLKKRRMLASDGALARPTSDA